MNSSAGPYAAGTKAAGNTTAVSRTAGSPDVTDAQRWGRAFWIVHAASWMALMLIEYLVWRRMDEMQRTEFSRFLCYFLAYAAAAVISISLRYLFRTLNYQKPSVVRLSLFFFVGNFICANAWNLAVPSIHVLLGGGKIGFHGEIVKYFGPDMYFPQIFLRLWPFMLWSVAYFVIKFWGESRAQKQRADKASVLAQQAQFQMLRYQMNPHFLFNALNSIRSMISESPPVAKSMIIDLAEFLRYSLISKDYSSVTLRSELEAILHYLAIEKQRFEDKLDVELDVPPAAERVLVPCFIVHPLIENAIKHGTRTSPVPLRIRLRATYEDNVLRVSVANTGRWTAAPGTSGGPFPGTGIGLENVRRRLQNAFPERHSFEVREEGGWVFVEFQVRNPQTDPAQAET
ncbi:MAG: histidine kinase [Candidatus Eisenbacteria bacterium]